MDISGHADMSLTDISGHAYMFLTDISGHADMSLTNIHGQAYMYVPNGHIYLFFESIIFSDANFPNLPANKFSETTFSDNKFSERHIF